MLKSDIFLNQNNSFESCLNVEALVWKVKIFTNSSESVFDC